MKIFLLAFIFISFFFTNAIAQRRSNTIHAKARKASSKKKIIIKYGTASFYAKKFDGRRTANGEIYRNAKYSAACNVLPLNTWVKITNLKNKTSLVVKINDRLHAKNKRLVDLSRAAAKRLGYMSRGLTKVKLEVLNNFQLGKK